jgi:hypothetical protein
VLNIVGDTFYEQLGCVGFSPALSRLEAVVALKQTSGYDGDLCSNGSQEYVRFYLSFDNGATWQDQGVASFTAHDMAGPKPLEYGVTLPISVPEYFCFVENLPRVRAILSWNYEPPANTPDYAPIWGNVLDAAIQIPASDFIIFEELLAQSNLQLPANFATAVDLNQSIAATPPTALSTNELVSRYEEKAVPAHRFLYPEITKIAGNQALSLTPGTSGGPGTTHSLAALNINLGEVIASILATSGDTTYEELDCLGLDPNRSALVGVVKVKLPSGFNGGLCTTGSTEYVAFWVDWGSGVEYAGTATINTHDISGIPAGGLEYAAVLPVDAASHMQPCKEGPKTASVRAILSWGTPPPPANPDYVPVWGNQLDALVQIPAGDPFETGTPNIAIIGGIGVAQIDTTGVTAEPGTTFPGAKFALTGGFADPWDSSRQCPFGGQIVIQGLPSVGSKYRVWIQKVGTVGQTMLTDQILTTDGLGNSTLRSPDASGFFTYLDNSQNIDDVLAYWYSSGDEQWHVWLEIADMSDTAFGSTAHYLIQLDNTAPTVDIHIDSGGDCKQFPLATPIDGHFVARDLHFGAFSLQTLPSTIVPAPNEPSTATPFTSQTALPPGDVWTLSTTSPSEMIACGYVVQLQAWDNSIVGSSPGSHNYNHAEVGFCLVTGD